jgi:diguanylate cyclase (GGDEF)-like protein
VDSPAAEIGPISVIALCKDLARQEALRRVLSHVCAVSAKFTCPTTWNSQGNGNPGSAVHLIHLTDECDTDKAVELIREMRAEPESPPIIVINTRRDPYSAAEIMQAGADGYVVEGDLTKARFRKLYQDAEVAGEVRRQAAKHLLTEKRTTQAIIEQNHRLIQRNRLDSLTGLLNHAAIMRAVEVQHDAANRLGQSMCVAMVDVDFFKRLNDTEGHMVGDAVLRQIAQCLEQNMRAYDSIGRYGGEEFLLLLPNIQPDDARNILLHKREEIHAMQLAHPDSPIAPHVTASIGMASGPSGTDWQDVVKHADEALYEAKRLGRDRLVVWGQAGMDSYTCCDAEAALERR